MDIVASSHTLNAIRHALSMAPPEGPAPAAARILDRACRDGWITPLEIESLMLATDHRLHQMTPRAMLKAFGIPLQHFFQHPAPGARDAEGEEGVTAIDLARLLVALERVGLEIDAGPLCKALVPSIHAKRYVTAAELVVHWRALRRPDDVVTLHTAQMDIHSEGDPLVTPAGCRVRTFWNSEGREGGIATDDASVEMMIVTPPGGRHMAKHLPSLHGPRQIRAFLSQTRFERPRRRPAV